MGKNDRSSWFEDALPQYSVGGTRVKIVRRKTVLVPKEDFDRGAAERADTRYPQYTALRASNRAATKEREIKMLVDFFWQLWPFLMGGLALAFVSAGLMNPAFMLVGIIFGLLAWKGRRLAKWFDAKEAEAKERRKARNAAEHEAAVEAELAKHKVTEMAASMAAVVETEGKV